MVLGKNKFRKCFLLFSSKAPVIPSRLLLQQQQQQHITPFLIQWVPGVKRPGREVDHSPPTSAEVKKMWIYTATPTYAFMA
jgi:hypothetical protein